MYIYVPVTFSLSAHRAALPALDPFEVGTPASVYGAAAVSTRYFFVPRYRNKNKAEKLFPGLPFDFRGYQTVGTDDEDRGSF